ncbi:kinase-like domain-containing protein, partial [Mycena galericulata]
MSQSESSPAIAESTAEGASPAIPSLAAVTSESESVTVSESAASPPSEPDPTTVDTNSEPTPDAEDPFADPTSPTTLEPIVSPSEGELDGEIDEDIADEDEDEAANEDGDEDEVDEERDPDADDDDGEDEELEEALFWHDQILSELHRVCRDGDPSVTGSYKILDTLGTDRMGNTTYTARAARTGEIVAVRITHLPAPPVPRLAGQRLIAELFLVRDMRSHPNVLSFLDLYVAQDRAVWLVTEHLQGALTLEALIALNHAAFTEERMARIFLETCKGLAHLHEQLILHRDIRSASIIVSPAGRVKITAFTFAAQLPSAADKRRTMVSTLALPTTHSHYTPDKTHWTPPEVIRRQPYGPEVDVWALGITLIECIDGAPPYHAADPLKVLFLILVNGSPKPARDEGGVSEGLGRFLEGCLEVDVEKRKSVAELLEEGWLEGA